MAEAVAKAPRSGSTVMVACKLPNGLLADIRDGRGVIKATAFFRGSAAERRLERADDKGQITEFEGVSSVAGGFGLTEVSADFAEVWFKENADYEPVKRGLIFMSERDARGQAREKKEIKSGLEPIDPEKPDTRRGKIQTDERHLRTAA